MIFPPKLIAIHILGKNSQKEQIVRQLQELGVVHITEEDAQAPTLQKDTSLPHADKVSQLLLELKYLAEKADIPQEKEIRTLPEIEDIISEGQQFVEKYLPRMQKLVSQKQQLEKEKQHLIAQLENAKSLPFPIELPKAKNTVPLLFQSKKPVRIETNRAKVLYRRSGKQHFYRIFVPKSRAEELEKKLGKTAALKKIDIAYLSKDSTSFVKHTQDRIHAIDKELAQLTKRIESVLEGKSQLVQYLIGSLENFYQQQIITNNFKTTKHLFVAKGYCEQKDLESLKALEQVSITAKPASDKAPTKLANKYLSKHFEHITELFSIPKYGSIDPTNLVAFFYPFFFGFMLSDIGYGLLLMLSIFLLRKHFTGAMKSAVPIFLLSGFSAIVFGALFGSFFGNLIPLTPIYADAFSSAFTLLIASLIVGLVHMNLATLLQCIQQVKQKKPAKQILFAVAPFILLELVVLFLVLQQKQ